jgi:hypothetical protein
MGERQRKNGTFWDRAVGGLEQRSSRVRSRVHIDVRPVVAAVVVPRPLGRQVGLPGGGPAGVWSAEPTSGMAAVIPRSRSYRMADEGRSELTRSHCPKARTLLATLVVTAVLVVTAGVSSAYAAGPGPLPPGSSAAKSSTSGIARPSSSGVSTNALAAGCYGQTDQPHPSGHVAGTVNVVARTVCPSDDYVAVDQYRSRWYGWQGWGSGSDTGYGSASANAAGGCSAGHTYTYLAESYHEAAGYGYAYTSNSRRFTCP